MSKFFALSRRRSLATVVAALGLLVLQAPVGQWPSLPTPREMMREGQRANLTNIPFRFRLHRANGATWTEEMTLRAGQGGWSSAPPKPGEKIGLEGITGNGKGHVTIEFRELGGRIRLQLPARADGERLVPFWYVVKDSNGYHRLVQAATVEDAKQRQADLQKRPKLSPEQLESVKEMLRANFILFDQQG